MEKQATIYPPLYVSYFGSIQRLPSQMGAVQFIENLDRTSLSVSDDEFERNVEAAVSAIAEKHDREERRSKSPLRQLSEKAAPSRPEVNSRNSLEGERSSPRRANPQRRAATKEESDESGASGLLRTIQKPLSSFGRIFSDDTNTTTPSGKSPLPTLPPRQTLSTTPENQSSNGAQNASVAPDTPAETNQTQLNEEVSEATRISVETAQAQHISQAEHQTVVDTLSGMFPDLDKDVISDVVRLKEGRVGLAVDACLALSR